MVILRKTETRLYIAMQRATNITTGTRVWPKTHVPLIIQAPAGYTDADLTDREREIMRPLRNNPGFKVRTDPLWLPRASRADSFFQNYDYPVDPDVRHRGYQKDCYLSEAKYLRATLFAASAVGTCPRRLICDGTCAAWHSAVTNFIIRRAVSVPSDFALVTNQFRGCEPPSIGGCILPASSPFRSLAACAAAHHEAFDFGTSRIQADSRWDRIREMHIYAIIKVKGNHGSQLESDTLMVMAAISRRLDPVNRMVSSAMVMIGDLNKLIDDLRAKLASAEARARELESARVPDDSDYDGYKRDALTYRLLVESLQERNPAVPTDDEGSSTGGSSTQSWGASSHEDRTVLTTFDKASNISARTHDTIVELAETLASHEMSTQTVHRLGTLSALGLIPQQDAWDDVRI